MGKKIEIEDKETGATEEVTAYFLSETVKFKVAHSKDFAGKKYLKDGEILKLHITTAEVLVKKGVGQIVKEKE